MFDLSDYEKYKIQGLKIQDLYLVFDCNFHLSSKQKNLFLENQKFDIIIKDYFDKILINQQQIQTLTQLRDTLLPKLMSGEVRVKI